MKLKRLAMGILVGCAAVAGATERTADGRGLVDALTGTAVNGDPWPFRYLASAVVGGTAGTQSGHAIDRTLPNTWAPACVYQLERWGSSVTTTFAGLVPDASYTLELHLSENYFGGSNGGASGAGLRIWNVVVNGETKETGIDIFALAGGAYKALCRQYAVTADSDGRIVVVTQSTMDNSHFSGMAVFGTVAPSTPTFAIENPAGTLDLSATWSAATDVHRFYLQRADTADGPWTDIGSHLPEARSTTLIGAHLPNRQTSYRIVASNGVGVAASAVVTLASSANAGLRTRGETIQSDASVCYRVDSPGAESDPDNALAADAVSVGGYLLDIAADSPLAVGLGQTLTTGVLGIGAAGGKLSITGAGTVVPANDALVLAVEAGELSVEAGVRGTNARLAKNGAGRATFSGGLSGTDSVFIHAGAFRYGNASDETFAVPLSGAGTFEKTGSGVLTVTVKNPDFSGNVVVKEGTLRNGVGSTAYENASGTLTVEPDAALDVATPSLGNESVRFGGRRIIVSGAGPDGKGAIVNTSGKSQYNAFAKGELAGDVVFGGGGATLNESAGRWDFRDGSLAMNGHSIEKVGKNMVCLTGVALDEGGPVRIDVKEGYWSSETTTSYSGGPQNALNIWPGAFLDLYQMSRPITWSVNLQDGASVQIRYGTAVNNILTGPMTLTGTGNIFAKAGYCGTVAGPISGDGCLRSVSGDAGRIVLSGTNTYTGGTWVEGGDLLAVYKESLPGYGDPEKLTVTNGTFVVRLGPRNWDEADVKTFTESGSFRTPSTIGVSVPADETAMWTDPISFTPGIGFAKLDAGTLVMKDSLDLSQGRVLSVRGGALVLDGDVEHKTTRIVMDDGSATLVLTNGADVTVNGTEHTLKFGGRTRVHHEVEVNEGSVLRCSTDLPISLGTGGIHLGCSASGIGVMTVNGGTVKHKVLLGTDAGEAQGALYQNGGFVENQGGAANDIKIGNTGYGYYELNAGELDWWGYGTIGSAANGRGVMVMHGGLFKYIAKASNGRLGFSRGGSGVFYMDGGLVDFTAPGAMLAVGESNGNGQGAGAHAVFTVAGSGEARFGNKWAWFGNRKDFTAVINLNCGGILECGPLAVNSQYYATNRSTVVALLNFDGGVFRAASNSNLFPSDEARRADAVTVYAGGAVFDASNFTFTVNQSLEKPAGKGVASITLPDALLGAAGYIGSPFLTIAGGGGRGATAVATFDSKTRKVTGVRMTSMGTGYTNAPTVTVTGGGYTNIYSAAATLADVAQTGGVTVRSSTGTGIVKLAAANTFAGPVTVESGTLLLAHAQAFPSGNDLVLDGGTFDGAFQTVTAGTVRVTSGMLKNVTLVCDRLEKTGDGALTLDAATIEPKTSSALAGSITLAETACFSPGLLEGVVSGSSNWTGFPTAMAVRLSTEKANTAENWSENTTAVYIGYIWNRTSETVTWSFMESFDDSCRLWIDDTEVLYNGSWNAASCCTVSLSPGAHRFQARFGQGGGNAGPSEGCTNTVDGVRPTFGFGIDFQGRGERRASNYAIPVDPGDGSLFTTVSGVTAFAAPAATDLALSGPFAFTGDWTVDMAAVQAGRHLAVTNGLFDLSAVTGVTFQNAAELQKGVYVLAESADGYVGNLKTLSASMTGLPPGVWSLSLSGTKLRLSAPIGSVVFVR